MAEAAIGSWCSRPGAGLRIVPGQVVIDRLAPYCATFASPEVQADSLRESAQEDPRLLEAVEDFPRKRETGIPTALMLGGIEGINLQSQAGVSEDEEGKDFWSTFGERFPESQGYGKISRVGLSCDGRLAVIAHAWIGGFLMGVGKDSVFEKVNDRWEPSSHEVKGGWVS